MASISKRVSGAWQNTSYGIRGTATDTITTLPTTIYGDGTNVTISIKGNTVQSGTPTPDNPIMPQGTGERTGNLYDGTDISGTMNNLLYKNDFVYANLSQGTYTLAFDLETTATGTYASSIGVGTTTYSKDIQVQSGKTDGHFVFTFTIGAEDAGKNLYARFTRFATAVTITYTASNIMLNTGSTALPYEPFGVKIPISSANTTTPVYLGEVESTRKIKKLVLTGQENWTVTSVTGATQFSRYVSGITDKQGISSHYKWLAQTGGTDHYYSSTNYLFIFSETITTETDFKSYLAAQYAAGTPVTIWYVLATPTTSIVNDPLMKIDSYADEVNGISIPTTDGATTLSIDTTVQPAEVSVNYHGWHMGTVHERVSSEWD